MSDLPLFDPPAPARREPGPIRRAVDADIEATTRLGGMVANQTAAATLRTLADQLDLLDADLSRPHIAPTARVARASLQRVFEASYRATLIAPAPAPPDHESETDDPLASAFAAFTAAEIRHAAESAAAE